MELTIHPLRMLFIGMLMFIILYPKYRLYLYMMRVEGGFLIGDIVELLY
jgi:hypothetical protein